MRRSSDLPRRMRRRRISTRAVLIGVGVLILFVVVFGRALARFYVDYLWYDGLGRADVFWTAIGARLTLFAMFFGVFAALAGINLVIADRLAPTRFPANVHPYVERFHEVFGQRLRLLRYVGAGVLALMLAVPATSQWQSWLLFRNSQSFGVADEQFGIDVSFYVFELPFLAFVLDWLFAAMIVVLLLTTAAHVLNGGVVFASPMPSVRPATKGHIAALLAVLATVKAADYWVRRYETTNERRGFVQGATYAVVNAQLPALMLLVLVAVLTAGLYLVAMRTGSWRLPLVASALWLVVLLVGGVVYPAVVQSLVVNPNQQSREAEYIERNVLATRDVMGIDDVIVEDVGFSQLDAEDVADDLDPLRRSRLLNPTELRSRFRVDRGEVAGLTIDDLDVDRYLIDQEMEQVLIAARELDLNGIANQSWQGRHLINTRGCGLVMAPVSHVLDSGRPDYRSLELDRPELYFSPSLTGYAIAGTGENERDCGDNSAYTGTAGVRMSSFARRAAFALAFLDYNVLGSGAIEDDSQMLWVRDVRDRVSKLAPFLSYDGDPYPVALDGRVVWVLDAYTTTTRYPYGQRIGNVQLTERTGLSSQVNYVRNSVKAVVDAYDGSVRFYVNDPDDPIIRAWSGAFGDLFTPGAEMPDELRAHLRYPEDLFRVQTDIYSKYRLDWSDFFERTGAWSVAQAPPTEPRESATGAATAVTTDDDDTPSDFASESNVDRFIPYYTLFESASEVGREDFVILRPFVPFSRTDDRGELTAYMTASSDPDTYGQLVAYTVTAPQPAGPLRVASSAESEPLISREISFQNQSGGGTKVRFGDMQLVPVADGLVYVRPFYVAVPQDSAQVPTVTEYRFVIASHTNRSAYGSSLGLALAELFPGFDEDLGDVLGGAPVTSTPPEGEEEPTQPPPPDGTETAAELLVRAETLLTNAEAQLREDGDLGAYQDAVEEATDLVTRALALVEGEGEVGAGD